MPIYMEISKLYRVVTIVARGKIAPEEIMGTAQKLVEAQVPAFAKIVDLLDATAELNPEQIGRIATLLRGGGDLKRGPVAFMVDPKRGEFARAFAATETGERPAHLFKNLREARAWLAEIDEAARKKPADGSPWSDPERQAVMFRGGQTRDVPVGDRPAYNAA
ncbi:MAG: hypothetical protein J0J01_31335 [Reyranella sp.]|uniref:hypothetical protein n=1 Tax=Reyranella sp. TaxID=1929291 RepID=UPI001AC6DA30|nr:hypothetical protein [Reyranella sp.]MBN9091435.1 hypothetical protein [Reyranella sp.]